MINKYVKIYFKRNYLLIIVSKIPHNEDKVLQRQFAISN